MLRLLIRALLRLLYGFQTYGEDVLRTEGPVLLLANHVSWWDWLILGGCVDHDWRFVTSSNTAELTWVHKRIMSNRRTFAVDMNSPYAVKHIAAYLHGGGRLVLFPEGRMSRTGSLMKLFEGTGFLITKTHAKVITAYIRGAARLPLSPNPNRKRWFPRISIHFSNVLTSPSASHVSSTETRTTFTNWLLDRMLQQQFETELAFGSATLTKAITSAARKRRGQTVLQDATFKQLTYGRLLTGATVLCSRWEKLLLPGHERVGVVLPNTNAFPVVLLSLWMAGKVPAILNYTSGPATVRTCAALAGIKQVLTSRTFIDRAQLDVSGLESAQVELIFLEEIRAGLSVLDRLKGAFIARFLWPLRKDRAKPDDTALVLFTSGSEGEPKGVELSHANLLANIRQMLSVIDLTDSDRLFNALPLFHSFGLTIGLLLPLVQGNFVFLYLSPLHYRIVPAAFYNSDCTVLFGTNTFLSAYAHKAHPYDFRSLRYVFAGAERLQARTANEWMNKFGVRILEGYGATECSPCVSVNVPMHSRPGSAGRFLPAIEYRLAPVEGMPENPDSGEQTSPVSHSVSQAAHPVSRAGRLFVRGPNIMRGYLNEQANREFKALNGWYDTGDIARVDHEGYLFLLGRLKRFAKISGEMISLTAIEDALCNAFPQYGPRFSVAILSRPDPKRGENLMVVTNEAKLTLPEVRTAINTHGFSNLAVPKQIRVLPELPHLATGKINHRELEQWAASLGVDE